MTADLIATIDAAWNARADISIGTQGPVREAVVAFKDHGRWSLRTHLGDALARSVAAAGRATTPFSRSRPV